MKMSVGVLDHYNVSTRKLNDTVRFYEDILGFMNGPRPPFDFPGAWLYSAGHAVLHLNDISETDKQQRPDSGVSITLHSAAAASKRRGNTSPARAYPITSTRCLIVPVSNFPPRP